jgi:hypothetical protein
MFNIQIKPISPKKWVLFFSKTLDKEFFVMVKYFKIKKKLSR